METFPDREAGTGNTPPYVIGGCSRSSQEEIPESIIEQLDPENYY
jgi:hypothetical protein